MEKPQDRDLVAHGLEYGQVAVRSGSTAEKQVTEVGAAWNRPARDFRSRERTDRVFEIPQVAVGMLSAVAVRIPKPDFVERFTGSGAEAYCPLA